MLKNTQIAKTMKFLLTFFTLPGFSLAQEQDPRTINIEAASLADIDDYTIQNFDSDWNEFFSKYEVLEEKALNTDIDTVEDAGMAEILSDVRTAAVRTGRFRGGLDEPRPEAEPESPEANDDSSAFTNLMSMFRSRSADTANLIQNLNRPTALGLITNSDNSAARKDVKNHAYNGKKPMQNSHFAKSLTTQEQNEFIHLRRLKQLKQLVLWLQPEPRFGMFCYYGCWCLPDAGHGFVKGIGKPVDMVDRSCQTQHRCWSCAKKDYGEKCSPERTKYSFELTWDVNDKRNTEKRGIICKDPWVEENDPNMTLEQKKEVARLNCKRSICECDKKLALNLRKHTPNIWDVNNHSKWGSFDKPAQCVRNDFSNENGSGQNQNEDSDTCCGTYEDGTRQPFQSKNGKRACCGQKTYNTKVLECCRDDVLKRKDHCPA